MENQLKKLIINEKELLLKAPVLISILAASTDEKIDRIEQKEAIELSHLRTFTSSPILQPFYKEVERIFEKNLEELLQKYEPFNATRQNLIKSELKTIYNFFSKLDEKYEKELKESLESYRKHIANVHIEFTDFSNF